MTRNILLTFICGAFQCLLIGLAVALFLATLDLAIEQFWIRSWLLYLLPAAGALSGWVYFNFGKQCQSGNAQIYQEIKHLVQADLRDRSSDCRQVEQTSAAHDASSTTIPKTPFRMAPLVFLGTIVSHLCGGSVGREGTAIQIGGAISSGLCQRFGLQGRWRRLLLQGGISAGFGAVFGTPLAATIFAVEVVGLLRSWRLWWSLPVCLISALTADRVTSACGIRHTEYSIASEDLVHLSLQSLCLIALTGVVFGMTAWIFINAMRLFAAWFAKIVTIEWLRPAVGGVIIIVLTWSFGSRDSLSLGVYSNRHHSEEASIVASFESKNISQTAWMRKIATTSVSLGSGLKGGEATPLFFIGATLGNSLSHYLRVSTAMLAGLGFVAVFAAATRTPWASALMAIELFPQKSTVSFLILFTSALLCSYLAAVVCQLLNRWTYRELPSRS